MELAIIILSGLVIGEGFVIFQLLNRLLAQAKIAPIELPKPEPEPEPERPRRKLMSVPLN